MGPHHESRPTGVLHWPGMRSEYSWIPAGECAGRTQPGQVGASFTHHRDAVFESGGRTTRADIAGGAVFVTGHDPIIWNRVEETSEALEIYPDLGSRDFDPAVAVRDGTVLAIATILRRVHTTGSWLSDVAASTLARRLADHVSVHYAGGGRTARRRTGRLDRTTVDRVTDLIEGDLDGELTLDRLAAEAHLSPFHFARAFKATTGMAPHQFVMARRMDRAKTLLLGSTGNVVDVAYAVGLSNVSHFRRVFRRHTGVLPGELRERNRKNRPPVISAGTRSSPRGLQSLPVPRR
jgi:AraC family transcriptional regulator